MNLEQLRQTLSWKVNLVDAFHAIPEYEEFADYCYQKCIKWFGEPIDKHWDYEIMAGPYSCCQRNIYLKEYIIMIDRNIKNYHTGCAHVAHEMYHRVTFKKRGLRELSWVDELVACKISNWLLRDAGLANYVDRFERTVRKANTIADANVFHNAKFKKICFGLKGRVYPEGYGATVTNWVQRLGRL